MDEWMNGWNGRKLATWPLFFHVIVWNAATETVVAQIAPLLPPSPSCKNVNTVCSGLFEKKWGGVQAPGAPNNLYFKQYSTSTSMSPPLLRSGLSLGTSNVQRPGYFGGKKMFRGRATLAKPSVFAYSWHINTQYWVLMIWWINSKHINSFLNTYTQFSTQHYSCYAPFRT